MQTPAPIRWFSRLWIGSLIASVVVTVATWSELIDAAAYDPGDPDTNFRDGIVANAFGSFFLFSVGISLLLWWHVMRRRSRTARNIVTVLSVIGFISTAVTLAEPFFTGGVDPDQRALGWRVLEIAVVLAGLVANALLFAPRAQRWFTRDPDFSDVFS